MKFELISHTNIILGTDVAIQIDTKSNATNKQGQAVTAKMG